MDETWQHLLMRVDATTSNRQITLVPTQSGMETSYDTNDTGIVDRLNDLGRAGWHLVAVEGDRYWLRRRAATEGDPADNVW